jgi:hypothetical protein
MRLRGAVVGGLAAAAIAGPAQACPLPVAYPGDDAPKVAIAQWMARGASGAGLPRELPVMGALVASGLQNLAQGGSDSAGYFQMRVALWNTGQYAGYPDHAELQLKWFIDYATKVRQMHLAQGEPDPLPDENAWGSWVADVLLPPEQYRGAYQLRLAEARELIGPPCPGDPGPAAPVAPAPVAVPDTTAPVARLGGTRNQHPLRRGAILVEVTCPGEACRAAATGTLRLPGRARVLHLRAQPAALAQGQTRALRLALSKVARSAVRRALRTHRALQARLLVTVTDTAGNAATTTRTVRLVA